MDSALDPQATTLNNVAVVTTTLDIALPDSGRFGPVIGECADGVDFLCE